jgi:hypothetical protein
MFDSKAYHNAYMKVYRKTYKYKNQVKLRRSRPDVRERERQSQVRYESSERGKARRIAYNYEYERRPERRKRKREVTLFKKFGITLDQVNEIRSRQQNKCGICASDNPTHIDHCHSTGVVRGILCHHCNLGLGNFKDSTSRMGKAIEYINKYK